MTYIQVFYLLHFKIVVLPPVQMQLSDEDSARNIMYDFDEFIIKIAFHYSLNDFL